MGELKKCPFCGGDGVCKDNGYDEPGFDSTTGEFIGMMYEFGDKFWYECKQCGATSGEKESPEEALEAWNKRV